MNTQHLLMNKNEVVIDSNNIIKEKNSFNTNYIYYML